MAITAISVIFPALRDVLATVTGLTRVYAAGDEGEYGIPDAISEMPAVICYPEAMVANQQGPTQNKRHEWYATILVLVSGGDTISKVNTVLPLIDAIMNKLDESFTLNNTCTYCRVTAWRFGYISYDSTDYTGFEITLFISQDGTANYAR